MTKIKFYKETEFKKTEIGEIPREWEVRRVKDVLKFAISVNGIKEKEIYKKGKYPVINQGREFITGFSDKKELLINDDLPVIVFGDHTCEIKYVDFPFIVGGEGVKLLKPINSLNASYFFYALENFKPKPQHYRRHFKILKDTFISLPPLHEQKAIAKVLKDFDDILEVIEKKRKTLQRIKKGLMEVYFTKGVFEHKEFKDTEIGKIPKEWEVRRLGEAVLKIKAGGTPKTSIKEFYEGGNIPFVKIEDLTTNGKYLRNVSLKITERGLENSSAWLVPENSLLLAMYGSLGEVSINKIRVATNQAILGIIPNSDKLDLEYLYYWLLYFKPKWSLYAKTTTQANLTKQIVENSYIPLPPLSEQKAIAQRLKTIDDQIENLKNQKETLQKIKKKFMDLLLTGKIRVREVCYE